MLVFILPICADPSFVIVKLVPLSYLCMSSPLFIRFPFGRNGPCFSYALKNVPFTATFAENAFAMADMGCTPPTLFWPIAMYPLMLPFGISATFTAFPATVFEYVLYAGCSA